MKQANRTNQFHQKANALLPPWGAQLLSKRPEQYAPHLWPSHFSRAKGCEVWDLDNNKYLDFSQMSVGACLLGYADSEVNQAVSQCISDGNISTFNPPEEVDLAEKLIALHPWAGGARFARGGGEAMAIASRIARAATGRSVIAVCGYHGWQDWYLAANLNSTSQLDRHLLAGLEARGVPGELEGTLKVFHYNQIEELEKIVEQHGPNLAAICMEPMRYTQPLPGFLEKIKAIATDTGALLIFDEITSGWRFRQGGLHLDFGISPDLAVFAKGMSNGYPMAAVLGTEAAFVKMGNCFISSTYWTERIGPVAALATIEALEKRNAWSYLQDYTRSVADTWNKWAKTYRLPMHADENGAFAFFHMEEEAAEFGTALYTQLMLEKGFLSNSSFYATLAHGEHLNEFDAAVKETFSEMAAAREANGWEASLRGPMPLPGFQRLT